MNGMIPTRFQELFREHYPSVLRKISLLVADRAAAEDLAQEVFLRLYRTPPDDMDRVGAWLHRVLTHTTYDYLRRAGKYEEIQAQERNHLLAGEQASPSNEQIVIEHWEREVVRRVLQKLSDRDREALLLKENGYSYSEIAAKLQVNPKTVGTLIKRASARFKKNYMQEESMPHEKS